MSDAPIAARPKGAPAKSQLQPTDVSRDRGDAIAAEILSTGTTQLNYAKPQPDPFEVMQNVADELKTVDRATRRRIIETLLSVM